MSTWGAPTAFMLLVFITAASLVGVMQEEDNTSLVLIRAFHHSQPGGLGMNAGGSLSSTAEMVHKRGDCDLTRGKWVRDSSYPLYNTTRCPFVEEPYLCHTNGRPDLHYLHLRWKPTNCYLPRFDARGFMERMRNQRVVFIGDSLGRNQFASLLCMASEGLSDPSSIYEVNGNPITKHSGFLVFKIPEFNVTIEYYRSLFLVVQGSSTRGYGNENLSRLAIHLDEPDYVWNSSVVGAGLIVFNTGHWWNEGKVFGLGYHFQRYSRVDMNMTVDDALPIALQTLRKWVDDNIDLNRSRAFFRGYSPGHYRNGSYLKGGSCNQYTAPVSEDELPTFGPVPANTHARRAFSGSGMEFLDISRLSMYRADSHLTLYISPNETVRKNFRQDCSHWCLPGVPDTWNEVMYAQVLRGRRHTWDAHMSPNR